MFLKQRVLNAYSGTTYPEALLALKGLDVVIVSGFGRSDKKVGLLRTLSMQNRSVTFLVGTQNCFTSASFIEAGRALARELKNFEFVVDFRVPDSVHYKLVLAGRDVVILGSSNFTKKGLSGEMDLMGQFLDEDMVAEVHADLVRVRGQPGVLSSRAPGFAAALKEYAKAAGEIAEQARKMSMAASALNPFKEEPLRVPTLTEWLSSDDADAIRIFAYKEGLDTQEQKAGAVVQAKAKERNLRLSGLITYCPQENLFDGLFLEVNGMKKKPQVFAARVEFARTFRNRHIVLGRRQKIESLGFSLTALEKTALAKAALDKCEGRLSVREMRKALGVP